MTAPAPVFAPLSLPLAYPVHAGRGLLEQLGAIVTSVATAHRYALISDTHVAALHGASALASLPKEHSRLFCIPPGESEKTRARWSALSDALFDWGAGRDTTIIALGGGVIGDLAGFVAATFMRGVPVVQVPTTLLAMVDASIGGKTGVDTPFGKNLVGTFHDPRAVIMATESLATLPAPAFRSGLAEIIKHGIVADAAYYEATRRALPEIVSEGANARALVEMIAGSVRIKAHVVSADAREAGRRQILNFGHTIGHAIEHAMGYQMLHGEAVAIGMVIEARIAEALSLAEGGLAEAIAETLTLAGLPTVLPPGLDPAGVLALTMGDKKARAGAVRYALPRAIGLMDSGAGSWSTPVADNVVFGVLSRCNGRF